MTSRTATIEDVARLADVSVATVSRALRGLPNVAPATRARVQKVATEVRYRPDPSASRLAAGKTATIALAVPVLESWYFTKVMAGAESVCADAGYDLLLFSIKDELARERLLEGPLMKRADGLILVDLRVPPGEAAKLRASDLRLVTVGFEFDGATRVVVDDRRIGRLATDHLLDLGHRDIGVIRSDRPDPMDFVTPKQRLAGYHDALTNRALPVDPQCEVAGSFSLEGGYEAMIELLSLNKPPTAVFAMSDEMAFGAIRAIDEAGLSVPDDISIIGVDNHEFSTVVGLTTIDQHVDKHGAAAAQLLLDLLRDPARKTETHLVSTELISRRTTATAGAPT